VAQESVPALNPGGAIWRGSDELAAIAAEQSLTEKCPRLKLPAIRHLARVTLIRAPYEKRVIRSEMRDWAE